MAQKRAYRWERRKRKESKPTLHLDVFDFVGIILLFALFFISLRLFFTFEVVRSPCAEILGTIGSGEGLPSTMTLMFISTLLFGLYWICVALNASLTSELSKSRIIWYLTIFIAIIFLAIFNRAYVPAQYVKPPDGTLLVSYLKEGQTEPLRWAKYEDGQWYAYGRLACVWLDENKIAAATDWEHPQEYSTRNVLGLGRPHIDMLMENQGYRTLTDYERQRFKQKQACQADLSLYGQPASICEHAYLYKVQPGVIPPRHVIEGIAPHLLMADKISDQIDEN